MKSQMSLYDFHRLLASFSYFYPEDFYRLFYTAIAVKRIKGITIPKISCTSCGKRLSRKNKTGLCANCFTGQQAEKAKEKERNKIVILCTKCGSQITSSSTTGFCQGCVSKEKRQKLPSKDIILKELETLSQVEVAKKYRVHPGALDKYFRRNNINMAEIHQLKRVARENKLISKYPSKGELLQDLKTMLPKEIAKKYNTSTTTVAKWVKYYEINIWELKDTKHKRKSKKIKPPSRDSLMLDLKTMKYREIAEKCDVAVSTVYCWIKQYKINVMELKYSHG